MKQDPKDIQMFDVFADDLMQESNVRLLVIVGTSKVDYLLFEILSLFLLTKHAKVKEQDELLEGDAPLATFSARIKMCSRLGLIDETLYITLEQLRKLRNLSAHQISFDVAKSPVREHLSELRRQIASRQSFRLTRERYFNNVVFKPFEELQCLLLTLSILLEAIRKKTIVTRGNKSTKSISSR